MKIFFSPYQQYPLAPLNTAGESKVREGVLLKIQWPDGLTGYADLHPWPELGDGSLAAQMQGLRKGRISSQLEQSIWLARRDAVLRKDKKNIFEQGARVKNNYIISDLIDLKPGFLDEIHAENFTHVKIKVGRDWDREQELLSLVASKGFRVRLDFNAMGSWQTFQKFMSSLSKTLLPSIEYVEDPFPYDKNTWAEARKLVRIAVDNEYSKVSWKDLTTSAPFDVLVIKPAKMDVERALSQCQQFNLKAVVTNYMDHPVGGIHALGVAMELKKKYGDMMLDSGCLTHHLFKMTSYSAEIRTQGPFILKGSGSGVGFDALLEAEPWQPVKLE